MPYIEHLGTSKPLDERSMAAKARLVCRCGPPRACSLYADWPFFLRVPQDQPAGREKNCLEIFLHWKAKNLIAMPLRAADAFACSFLRSTITSTRSGGLLLREVS